jgi:hypothetical protein
MRLQDETARLAAVGIPADLRESRRDPVDRHLQQLLEEGRLKKVSGGVYMAPRKTRFGAAPAAPEELVGSFLHDDRFLLVSPNAYNGLGVETYYNTPVATTISGGD